MKPDNAIKENPKSKFDPITLEIYWRRLVSIVDEADASVARTAFSSLWTGRCHGLGG
jgi:hypothetical protein